MVTQFESSFKNQNNVELFYQGWSIPQSKGTLVVTHGLAEHTDCYAEMAHEVNAAGWDLIVWDLQGHGRSEGKRGFISNFKNFEQDLIEFIGLLQSHKETKNKKIVMFGHSMGGLITINALGERGVQGLHGLVLSSPALGLAVKVPEWKDKASHWLNDWLPRVTMSNEIKYKDLTRDAQKIVEYGNDNLRHDKISPGVYLGMQNGFRRARASASQLKLPTLAIIAGDDRIVSSIKAQEFFDLLPGSPKKMQVFSESLHEVFNDLDKAEAYTLLRKFLNEVEAR